MEDHSLCYTILYIFKLNIFYIPFAIFICNKILIHYPSFFFYFCSFFFKIKRWCWRYVFHISRKIHWDLIIWCLFMTNPHTSSILSLSQKHNLIYYQLYGKDTSTRTKQRKTIDELSTRSHDISWRRDLKELVGKQSIEQTIHDAQKREATLKESLTIKTSESKEVSYDKYKRFFSIDGKKVTVGEIVVSRHFGTTITLPENIEQTLEGRKLKKYTPSIFFKITSQVHLIRHSLKNLQKKNKERRTEK